MAELTVIKNIQYKLLLTPTELKTIHNSLEHVFRKTPDHLRGLDFRSVLEAIENCKKGE